MLSVDTADALATALEYPRHETGAQARAGLASLDERHRATREALAALADELEVNGVNGAEERYTRLFDLKPVCTLNMSWHIFGDTYDRGALLAELVPELDAHGVAHQHDLPDYLPTLLRLLGRLSDEEDQQLLTHAVLLPALSKITRKLDPSTDVWSRLLVTLPDLLASEVPMGSSTDIPVPRRQLEVLQC
jgi:nitrate reductase delta subunit